jgi:hypothetical protein
MNRLLTRCPICGGEITVTRLHCGDCDTTFEGRFAGGPFSQLSQDQLDYVELFVRCEGKLKYMAEILKVSYPTVRSRLLEVIRAMGYEPGANDEPVAGLSNIDRKRILENLDKGEITLEKAMALLQES